MDDLDAPTNIVGDDTAPQPGLDTVVNNYRLVRRIGAGGCGVVYEAVHCHLGWRAAIKLLRNVELAGEQRVERLLGEGVAAARIGHPGVVAILDYGYSGSGAAYLVMEYLEGQSLADRIRSAPVAVDTALDLVAQIAEAMEAAHRAGIVHRDLKPEHAFLVGDPASPRVKVLDFGIAKSLGDRPISPARTTTGVMLGTPHTMSPEQVMGETIDQRSDIYSLGCILYQLCCGSPPFVGNGTDVLLGHLQRRPPRLTRHGVDVPVAVEALIAAMMAKLPGERPGSMAEVAARVRQLQAHTPWAFIPRPTAWLPTVVRRRAVSVGPFSRSAARRRVVFRTLRWFAVAITIAALVGAVVALRALSAH